MNKDTSGMTKGENVCTWMAWMLALFVLVACQYPEPDLTRWDLSRSQRDSLEFCALHHYGPNYNFLVTADSLQLRQVLETDSLTVREGEVLVVADYALVEKDSTQVYWIKVARDQETMGWIEESVLLGNVVPVDPISRFIHFFTNWRTVLCFIVCGGFILFYILRKDAKEAAKAQTAPGIDLFYQNLFLLCVVVSAAIYASIQRFAPETWEHYYFHPSLNPIGLPFILSLFIASVWVILIVGLAMIEDLSHQLSVGGVLYALLSVGTTCFFFYLIVTLTVYYYIGYPVFLLIVYWQIKLIRQKGSRRYRCGHCGKELYQTGVCPHCGYLNR